MKLPVNQAIQPISLLAAHPTGVDLSKLAQDPTYGYQRVNPVRLRLSEGRDLSDTLLAYFDSIFDSAGEDLEFESQDEDSSPQPYEFLITTSTGIQTTWYIEVAENGEDPLDQLAPVGFYKLDRQFYAEIENILRDLH